MLNRRATGGYKGTKLHRVCKGVGVAHGTACNSRTTYPREREGAMPSSRFLRREVKEIVEMLKTPEKIQDLRNVSMEIRHFINEFSVFTHRIFPV